MNYYSDASTNNKTSMLMLSYPYIFKEKKSLFALISWVCACSFHCLVFGIEWLKKAHELRTRLKWIADIIIETIFFGFFDKIYLTKILTPIKFTQLIRLFLLFIIHLGWLIHSIVEIRSISMNLLILFFKSKRNQRLINGSFCDGL